MKIIIKSINIILDIKDIKQFIFLNKFLFRRSKKEIITYNNILQNILRNHHFILNEKI